MGFVAFLKALLEQYDMGLISEEELARAQVGTT